MLSGIPEKADDGFSYSDYLTWDDGKRWELIDGIPFDMTPAPLRKHQDVLGTLFHQIYSHVQDSLCKVYLAPFDVRLPNPGKGEKDQDIPSVVQPDLAVICDRKKLDDRGCKGAPDLVIEILSTYTSKRDLGVKLRLYERVGVKEYWVVHPQDEIVLVFRPDANAQYGKPDTFGKEDKIEVDFLSGLVVDLGRVFRE